MVVGNTLLGPLEVGDIIYYSSGLVLSCTGKGARTDLFFGEVLAGTDYWKSGQSSTTWVLNSTEMTKIVKKERNMLTNGIATIKSYADKHKDTLVTIAILLLVDHFFFEGKMRERIKSTVEKLFDKLLAALD